MKRFLLFTIILFNSVFVLASNLLQTNALEQGIGELSMSNWRDIKTGDWAIGFYEDGVVYKAHFWKYKQKEQKKGKYRFLITNGTKDISLEVNELKNNLRKIVFDNSHSIICQRITTQQLPDYPAKDLSPIKDTHYKHGEMVTLVGWMRNMPASKSEKKHFDVVYSDVFTDKDPLCTAEIDNNGFFRLTFPLVNTTEVYLDQQRARIMSVFEPGETYFLLCDFKTGERFFMGANARLQNEMLRLGIVSHLKVKEDREPFSDFMERVKIHVQRSEESFKKLMADNPNLSDRFKEYVQSSMKYNVAYAISQSKYSTPTFKLPQDIREYLYQNFWKNPTKPATLYREMVWFMTDLLNDYTEKTFAETLQNADKMYKMGLTDKEKVMLARWDKIDKEMQIKFGNTTNDEEKRTIYQTYKNENSDVWRAFESLSKKYATEIEAYNIRCYNFAIDSLGCTQELKDILLAARYCKTIERQCHSLPQPLLCELNTNVEMAYAKDIVMQEHLKYFTIEQQSQKHDKYLKNNADVSGLEDGKELFNKITSPHRGHYILLDVWGTWCGPCKEALSHSQELFKSIAPYDVIFMYLANNSPVGAWKNCIQQYKLTGDNCVHYNLPPNQQGIFERYIKLSSYPSYRLISPEGNILDLDIDPRTPAGLARLIKALSNNANATTR